MFWSWATLTWRLGGAFELFTELVSDRRKWPRHTDDGMAVLTSSPAQHYLTILSCQKTHARSELKLCNSCCCVKPIKWNSPVRFLYHHMQKSTPTWKTCKLRRNWNVVLALCGFATTRPRKNFEKYHWVPPSVWEKKYISNVWKFWNKRISPAIVDRKIDLCNFLTYICFIIYYYYWRIFFFMWPIG